MVNLAGLGIAEPLKAVAALPVESPGPRLSPPDHRSANELRAPRAAVEGPFARVKL
jgi:hypothetical protein